MSWIPPWRNLRYTQSWVHTAYIIKWHETFDLLTGGYLTVSFVAFVLDIAQRLRVFGARRFIEFSGPSLAFLFFAHGTKGLRLAVFAGSLYVYANLHEYAKTQSRALLTRIGQRVLEVS
jgi:hypothetical protein